MNSKERLQEYVNLDTLYQDYKNGKDGFSDFDMVCIEHCKDIEELLLENENLRVIEQKHQELNATLRKELQSCGIEKLKNRIHALEKHNNKLQLEAQKYFDMLMECEYKKENNKYVQEKEEG